jgi:5-methyltetrahydropteroyltriglutamate--homocysteine methyltransferase
MKRSEKRILTTHVGSLVRTPELKALSKSGKDRAAAMPSSENYEEILKRATAEVVKKQAAAGVDVISDGEFGKSS